ncbi:DNA damage-induced apoptosis suppressor protein [Narcine bancroftii]|uniref:DNA damage-induced apoptosis suppressor protein n=1 Tax=Narcine bancroftii TaxID=1343680 RepID=UPI00383166B5
MNEKRYFVAASILHLHDTCFLYPACEKCGSRILFNHGRFQCPRRDCLSIAQNVNYRYRLSAKVAGKGDIFNITIFGSCLEPYFGAAAGFLNRYCEDLKKELEEPEEGKVQDLLVQAVEHCFIGRSFIFGVKASESKTGVLSFSPSFLQSTIRKRKPKKHLIVCQIAVPNTTVYGCTVIHYYKKLLNSIRLKDLSFNSELSTSIDQSTTKINNLSYLSDNTQFCTLLTDANQLSNPWQQDFALTFASGDCCTVEEFPSARTSNARSKTSQKYLDHVEGATCKGIFNQRKFSDFATSVSQNSSDINDCCANTTGKLPSSVELHRLRANECTYQFNDSSFELEDNLELSFDTQRFCTQTFGDSLSNWKDTHLPSDQSCRLLDCNDSTLWDELPFTESLGEFVAKVEASLERCNEENALPTRVNALTTRVNGVDGAIHSCFLKSLEIDYHSGVQAQKRRNGEQDINSTKCKLPKSRKTRNGKNFYEGDSNRLNGTVEHLALADVFKNDLTEKLSSPRRSRSVWSGNDSYTIYTPNPEAAGNLCRTDLSPINADNDSTYSDQTILPEMHNQPEKQVDQLLKNLNNHTINKSSTNKFHLLRSADFQTPLPSAKWLLKMKENTLVEDHEHNFDKCDQESVGSSRLLSILKNESNLFHNLCTNLQEYDVSGELFSDAVGNEEESPLCPKRFQCTLSPRSASKTFSKTTCKLSEQQCNISLHCMDVAAATLANENNISSPENYSQKLPKCDFVDSQDCIPCSQSTPVSSVKHLKMFRVGEKQVFKTLPYFKTYPKEAGFYQKQGGFHKYDHLKQQLFHIQKVPQSNQTSVSSKLSLLDSSPVSKSCTSDSNEWISPSTIKTQRSCFSPCVLNVHESQGFKLFKNVSHAGSGAIATTDSKTATEANKEEDSSNQFRGHLYIKRTPAGNYTTPSFQHKILHSRKVFQKRTEKLGALVSREFQSRKDPKMNESLPAAFRTFSENKAQDCYSPELFATSTEFSEVEYSSF